MLHIAHLETGRHLYGGAKQVLYLLDGLREQGVRSTLICPPDSAIYTAANSGSHTVVPIPTAGDLDARLAGRLIAWLNSARPDVLHVHSRRGADVWGGLAAHRVGIPAVLSRRVDNRDTPLIGGLKYRLYRKVIGISAEICSQLRSAGVSEVQLRRVHSAVAAPQASAWTRAQFRAAFNLADDDIAVVCVAQFIARKGQAYLLDAWPEVLQDCPKARLLLFGQGHEEAILRTHAARLGIADSVCFAGFRSDLPAYLEHADLLVHPALREGLGICLLEAQAAGVPVVATRAGGIPEAVADGESGLLVPPGATAALAAAIRRVIADGDLRRRLGEGGRRHVATNFSVADMVSGNLDIYRQMLGERNPV